MKRKQQRERIVCSATNWSSVKGAGYHVRARTRYPDFRPVLSYTDRRSRIGLDVRFTPELIERVSRRLLLLYPVANQVITSRTNLSLNNSVGPPFNPQFPGFLTKLRCHTRSPTGPISRRLFIDARIPSPSSLASNSITRSSRRVVYFRARVSIDSRQSMTRSSSPPLSQVFTPFLGPLCLRHVRHVYVSRLSPRRRRGAPTILREDETSGDDDADCGAPRRGPPRRCCAAGRYDVTVLTRTTARGRQGGTGWVHRVETAAVPLYGVCAHTRDTNREQAGARRKEESEKERERRDERNGGMKGWRGGKEGRRTGCA